MEAQARLTRAELLALPPTIDLRTSNTLLGVGRTKGQEMARNGTYPVRLLRVGNRYKAITAELLALLGVTDTAAAAETQTSASDSGSAA